MLFCIDVSGKDGVKFNVKNFYNDNERESFQVNIATCNSANRNCKNQDEISELMKHHYYNLQMLESKAELGVESEDRV